MSVALSVAFTGLCALVSGGDGTTGEVLLVDAKGIGQVNGVTLPAHAPTLVVNLADLANAESSSPTRVVAAGAGPVGGSGARSSGIDQIGLWDLTGSEVRIRAQGVEGTGLHLFLPPRGQTSWPAVPRNVDDPEAWRDLAYVPDMTTLVENGRIKPSLLGSIDSVASVLPPSVAARVYLDAGLMEGDLPSHERFRSDVFEFHGNGGEPVVRQPLTDTMRWTLQTGAQAIAIDITPVAGGPTRRLLLAPSASPHRVFISNFPTENPSHAHSAMTSDEMSALHFAAYYKLLMNEPAQTPLPAIRRVEGARKGAGFIREEVCFSARFTRE